MKKIRLLITAFLMIVAFPLASLAEPAMWRVEGDKGTLYILGSFHRLPEGVDWLSPEREKLLLAADTLVLEAVLSPSGEDVLGFLMQNTSVALSRKPLSRRLEFETYLSFKEQMEDFGYSEEKFNSYQPWYAATLLSRIGGEEAGFHSQNGVEAILQNRAEQEGIELIGLETPAQQLLFFADLPVNTQIKLLEEAISAEGDYEEGYRVTLEAWLEGNVEATEQLVLEPLKANPPMYEDLILNRNETWLEPIEELLARDGIHFVAVGTGHLVGPDSLLNLLAKRGYSVNRE